MDQNRFRLDPPAVNRRNDVNVWKQALDNAHAQLEHQALRCVVIRSYYCVDRFRALLMSSVALCDRSRLLDCVPSGGHVSTVRPLLVQRSTGGRIEGTVRSTRLVHVEQCICWDFSIRAVGALVIRTRVRVCSSNGILGEHGCACRLTNLELLFKYGANAWKANLNHLEASTVTYAEPRAQYFSVICEG
eukprot:1018657-Prorocentrum_minimum.AAC.5